MIKKVMEKYYAMLMSINIHSKNTNINLKKNNLVIENSIKHNGKLINANSNKIIKNNNKHITANTNKIINNNKKEIKGLSDSIKVTNNKLDTLNNNFKAHLDELKEKNVLVLTSSSEFVPSFSKVDEFNFFYTNDVDLFENESNFDFYIAMDKFQKVDRNYLIKKLRENKSFIDSSIFTNESIYEWNIPLNKNNDLGNNIGIVMTNQTKFVIDSISQTNIINNVNNFYPYKVNSVIKSNIYTSFTVVYKVEGESESEIEQNISKIFAMYNGTMNIVIMNNKYPMLKILYEMYKNIIFVEENENLTDKLNDYVLFFNHKTPYKPAFFNYISEKCKSKKESYFLGTPAEIFEELSVSKNRLVVSKDILEGNLSEEKWMEIIFSRTNDNLEIVPFIARVDWKVECTPGQYSRALKKVLESKNFDKNYISNRANFYYAHLKRNFQAQSKYNVVRFYSLHEELHTVLPKVLKFDKLSFVEKQGLSTEFCKLNQLESAILENRVTYKDGVCYYTDRNNNIINNYPFLINDIVKVEKVRNEYFFSLKLNNTIELLNPLTNYEVSSSNSINLICQLNDVISIAIKEGDYYEQKSFSIRDFV